MCTANKNNQQMHYRYKQPTNSSHSQWTWLPLSTIYKYNTSWKSYHGPCYCTFKVTTILVKTYPNTPNQQKLPTCGNQQKWHDKPDYWKHASKLADSGTGWVYFIMNKSQSIVLGHCCGNNHGHWIPQTNVNKTNENLRWLWDKHVFTQLQQPTQQSTSACVLLFIIIIPLWLMQ